MRMAVVVSPVIQSPQTPEPLLGSQAVVTCMNLPRVAVRDVRYVRYGKEGPVTVLCTVRAYFGPIVCIHVSLYP